MVNTGRPSRGCFTCKERKVKCDERKPSCGRCTRLQAQCTGYPDPWLLSLRRQDDRAAQLVRKRVEKTQRRRAEGEELLVPLTRTLDVGPEAASVCKFFDDYISRSGIAFLECLADRYGSWPPTCLSDAVHATALASLSRQRCQAGLMTCARQSYGKAIGGLRNAIQDESLMKDDSVLVALFVLGLFQTIAAEFAPEKSTDTEPGCQPHARGAMALLRYRAEHRLATSLDRGLLALFREIRLMDLFMASRIPSLWFELDTFMDSLDDGLSLEPLIRRAVNFKMQFGSLNLGGSIKGTRFADIRMPEIIQSGLSLAQGLEEAAKAIVYVNNPGTTGNPPTAFSGFIAVSSSTNAAIARCLYLTVRLHILEMVFEIVEAHRPDYNFVQSDTWACTGPLLTEVATTLDGIPSPEEPGIGSRTFSLFWPMTAVLRSTLVHESSKAWVRQKLSEAGTASGFGLAGTFSKEMPLGNESRA